MNKRSATTLTLSTLMLLFAAFACEVHATPAPSPQRRTTHQAATLYSCPMHPEVKSKTRGKCPKCSMALRPTSVEAVTPANDPVTAQTEETKKTETIQSLRIPDTTVYDQNGKRLNFYTDLVKGKTVAINFIFTTCTTICPPLEATFHKVQQELGERVGRDVQMISISVDPTTDTPARLKSFSEKFKAGPGWTFITGSKPEIDQLLRALGASVTDKNNHSPMLLVGNDAAGYWTRTYGLAPAPTIIKVITEAAAASRAAAGTTTATTAVSSTAESSSETSASYFPNITLLTQDGVPVRFYDDLVKGKIVLINFMFTTCNGVCPPMTANMLKVQKYLGEHVGREVVMISISVDPLTDTPPVLKKYADNFKAQPGWYFLTGKKENIDRVLYKLGGYAEDKMQHSAVLLIGNEATGDWMKLHALTQPAEISGAVMRMIESQEKARASVTQPSR
jgi:cytochrome oxidase Cu insertion factor (SCO1/SenC/PrrC family)